MLGLERRLPRLEEDVATLEREDDGELYGVISLQVIENELLEIMQLIDRLNSTTLEDQHLAINATKQVQSHRGTSTSCSPVASFMCADLLKV